MVPDLCLFMGVSTRQFGVYSSRGSCCSFRLFSALLMVDVAAASPDAVALF